MDTKEFLISFLIMTVKLSEKETSYAAETDRYWKQTASRSNKISTNAIERNESHTHHEYVSRLKQSLSK